MTCVAAAFLAGTCVACSLFHNVISGINVWIREKTLEIWKAKRKVTQRPLEPCGLICACGVEVLWLSFFFFCGGGA